MFAKGFGVQRSPEQSLKLMCPLLMEQRCREKGRERKPVGRKRKRERMCDS